MFSPLCARRSPLRFPLLLAACLLVPGLGLLSAGPAFAAPTNDLFANALLLSGASGQASGSALGATTEPGEPLHGAGWVGEPGGSGHSVWYRWVAPTSGRMSFSTSAVSVDLYSGSSVAALQRGGSDCDSDYGSPWCMELDVSSGEVVRIAVDGYEAPFDLEWHMITAPANDTFANAAQLSGQTAEIPAIDKGGWLATAEPGEPAHASVPASHSLWYRWTATWRSDVSVDVQVGLPPHGYCSWSDARVAVYTGSTLTTLSKVASDSVPADQPDETCHTPSVRFRALPGTTYRIAVDSSASTTPIAGGLASTPVCDRIGTTGNDTVLGTSGNDVLCGLEGNDTLKGAGGDDYLVGGPGVDAATYADSATGVTANLTTGLATGQGADTLTGIENLVGSAFTDKLDGDGGANVLTGGAGSDGLWGQGNNDSLVGGDGDDTLGGGPGDDRLNGGAGADVVHYGRAAAVTVNLATGSATGEGTDLLSLLENVTGSPGADRLTGSEGANVLGGAGGNDTIAGQGGNDKLTGAGGNDALAGGAGTDSCDGGTNTDTAATCEGVVAVP